MFAVSIVFIEKENQGKTSDEKNTIHNAVLYIQTS